MSTIRILIAGDWHGNAKQAAYHLNLAGERKIQKVVQVGDFGLWTHYQDGQVFLDELNKYAEANKLSVFAIGGNHDNWDHWNWYCENHPTSKGFAYVRERVLLAPKVHSWVWDHKQFVGAGGAVSIDKADRLHRESGGYDKFSGRSFKGTGARTQYWPNEQLTDEQVEQFKSMHLKADYLFTHDCSNFTPFEGRLKPDIDSAIHRQRIDKVINYVKPGMHFHGHMHTKYHWLNEQSHGRKAFMDWDGPVTKTYGLEADYLAHHRTNINVDADNWGVLDTDTNQFAFRGEGMTFRSLTV